MYEPPRHIILCRYTDSVTDKDVAFMAEALRLQLQDVARTYGLPAPGVTYASQGVEVPSQMAAMIALYDNDGNPGSAGYHGWIGGTPVSLVGVKEHYSWQRVTSHEAVEYFLNIRLDQWVLGPKGDLYLREGCDAVEAHGYFRDVELFGERKKVELCNWVTPAYWNNGPELTFGAGVSYDYLLALHGPFTVAPGGRAMIERSGVAGELDEYGTFTPYGGAWARRPRSQLPHSRTFRAFEMAKAGMKAKVNA